MKRLFKQCLTNYNEFKQITKPMDSGIRIMAGIQGF